MTYITGGLVQATDYNGFVSTTPGGNVNYVWNSLYGQTALTTVAVGTTVNANSWASLNTTLSNIGAHQGTALTSRTNPVTGNIIQTLNNLATDIANVNVKFANAATQGSQYTAWTGSASKTTATGSGTAAWAITFTNTVTFANATAASNFFNAGGTVKTQFSKTSTGTAQDTAWNTFVASLGAIYLSGATTAHSIAGVTYTGTTRIGGSGTPSVLATGTGFFNLTTGSTTLFQIYQTGAPYTSNFVRVVASVNSPASILTLTTTWYDNGDPFGAAISGGSATTGISFGTAPATVTTYFPPETVYLANTWGIPTIVSAVV